MDIKKILKTLRDFIERHTENSKVYLSHEQPIKYFKKSKIKVDLDNCKEIILQEETELELGGVNKKSFSLVYPLDQLNLINDGKITLIGPDINPLSQSPIDLGIFMIIGFQKITEKEFDILRQFNFISNGIEGFLIRTIPKRFWCRIGKTVAKNFSFEFFGNAIMYLYKAKFKDIIKAMELIFISSLPDEIEEFMELTEDIRKHINLRWKEKIEEWKKRVDCDYNWECDECPYNDACDDVKKVLDEREKLESS